jgi:hypothetical protein
MRDAEPVSQVDVLRESLGNRGTAFTLPERERLGLTGRLPARVETFEEHAARALLNVRAKTRCSTSAPSRSGR